MIERHFLGWETPLIPAAAAWLRRYGNNNGFDLTGATIVLPTRRGVRLMRSRLEAYADASGEEVRLGWIGTVGSLPEHLYDLRQVFGESTRRLTDLEQTLFWVDTLRSTPRDDLRSVISRIPDNDSTSSWMALAATVQKLATDLAAASVTLDQVADGVETAADQNRWRVLSKIHGRYHQRLVECDRTDNDHARRSAIDQSLCRLGGEIVLIGCTDLSSALVEMLQSCGAPVHCLVAAPASSASHFDDFGNVDRKKWATASIAIDDDAWIAAGDVVEQAETALAIVDRWQREDDFSAGNITVGLTDDSQVAAVEFSMRGRNQATLRNLGYRVAETAVGGLVRLVATHLRLRRWESLAALLRHPDAMDVIGRAAETDEPESLIVRLDEFRSETYAVRVDDSSPPPIVKRFGEVLELPGFIDDWLRPMAEKQQTLSARAAALSIWLSSVFAGDNPSPPINWRTASAAKALIQWSDQHIEIDPAVDPEISVDAMMDLVIAQCDSLRIIDEPGDGEHDVRSDQSINLLGWLDLVLDDAPAMIVVGLNHPFVPEAVTADAFLPGRLRTKFSIGDNERRYARDVHAMQCIVAARPHIKFVVGRSSADGSPTPPSRLIAAAAADVVASRIRRLLGGDSSPVAPPHRWDHNDGPPILPPDLTRLRSPTIDRMSVTSFKNYLTCPYRFYLRHVLYLKPIDDGGVELAANQFGDLVHHSLEAFGLGDAKDETDPSRIRDAMHDALSDYAKSIYGQSATAAVQLQVHQARQKLSRVAEVQAERIAAGWRIDRVEAGVNEDVAFLQIGGRPMGLRGRFDRIDHHPESGRYAILDYKTHGHKPEKKHLNKDGQWLDLQLPLYRRMIPFLGIEADPADVEVGYFNIADKDSETRINLAPFTDQQWQSADLLIDDIVRRIFAGDFQPADQPPQYDDYAMILQEGTHS